MTAPVIFGLIVVVVSVVGFLIVALGFDSDAAVIFIIPGMIGAIVALIAAIDVDREEQEQRDKKSCASLGGTFYNTDDMILETSGKARLLFYSDTFCVIEEN